MLLYIRGTPLLQKQVCMILISQYIYYKGKEYNIIDIQKTRKAYLIMPGQRSTIPVANIGWTASNVTLANNLRLVLHFLRYNEEAVEDVLETWNRRAHHGCWTCCGLFRYHRSLILEKKSDSLSRKIIQMMWKIHHDEYEGLDLYWKSLTWRLRNDWRWAASHSHLAWTRAAAVRITVATTRRRRAASGCRSWRERSLRTSALAP
jgi:hypothetical protein